LLYGSPYGRYGEAAFGGSTSPKDGGSAVSGPSDDVIALRHLRAGGGDCFGRLIARWSSFMHVSVYLEAESPCQFPVFQTTHFGALVRLLFHVSRTSWTSTSCSQLRVVRVPLQLRRLLRWSSIGAREGFCLLCLLSLEPWINKNFFKGQGQQVVWRVACVVRRWGLWWLVVVVCGAAWRRPRPARGKGSAVMSPAGCCHWPPR